MQNQSKHLDAILLKLMLSAKFSAEKTKDNAINIQVNSFKVDKSNFKKKVISLNAPFIGSNYLAANV